MKKIILVVVGIFIIAALVGFNYYTKSYFNNNDRIIKNFNLLKQKELKLNYEIFSISMYLYKNFDSIVLLEKDINKILDELTNDEMFKLNTKAYKEFLSYKKDIHEKIEKIYELEVSIAPLKNANMYIAELITKLPALNIKKSEEQIFLNITSQIFLAKSSLDLTFLRDLSLNVDKLKKRDDKFDKVFIKNVELVSFLFPRFVIQMNDILSSNTQKELDSVFKDFLISANDKLKVITIVSILLILFVVVSILLILWLFIILEKENKLLEEITITDELTGLYNRRKLEIDIENIKEPILFIVNIDRFKYYNDLYGNKTGDFILKKTATIIKKLFPSKYNPSFYRIGADDFGILIKKNIHINTEKIAKQLVEKFKVESIKFNDLEFHIFVTIGISSDKPLIETADIVLKKIKQLQKSVGIYDPSLQDKEKIEENIKKTHILKKAIENDNIIPYYQPIYSNKTGELVKYEVLARIQDGDKVMSIYPFLQISKENKEYKYITQTIYRKTIEKFKNTNIEFSLNLSIDDINEQETMEFIYKLVEEYPEVFKNITFEILEDDAIKNYDSLKEFIIFIKSKGSKIAIDDFGSGYSNFAHVLNLDIDYLKIDGSLIKYLDTDKKMELIVETIVEFTKKTGIEVIGEFVHSKEVLHKVKELNIDYSQGFYLAEPQKDIIK